MSDGVGFVIGTFVGSAAEVIKQSKNNHIICLFLLEDKIFENSIIQLQKYDFDRAGTVEA